MTFQHRLAATALLTCALLGARAAGAAPSTWPQHAVDTWCLQYSWIASSIADGRAWGFSQAQEVESQIQRQVAMAQQWGVLDRWTLCQHLEAVAIIYAGPMRTPALWRVLAQRTCLASRMDPEQLLR
jgi:hypothetical protein